jgi:hypothetical protein
LAATSAAKEEKASKESGWEDEALSQISKAVGFLCRQNSNVNLK